jgi:hypothetical protein
MEYKVFDFELKKLEEDGTFEGYAAIFRKGKDSDLGGDRIDPGAFVKTLQENPNIPLHWYHDLKEPVGEATGEEDKIGLRIKGQLVLDVQRAKELHALMKKTKRVARQLSIGYDAVKWEMDDNIRALKELRVWEIGIVTFGMDPKALITEIKCADCPLKKKPEIKMELKPYPNEHACQFHDSSGYDRIARMTRKHKGKEYSVLIGYKGDTSEDISYRYPKETWSEEEAKNHCKDHGGQFEPARGKRRTSMIIKKNQLKSAFPEVIKLMEKDGMEEIDLKQIPARLLEGLCASIGNDPGFFTRCMDKNFGDFDPGDKESFCAWLHHECLGAWPGEKGMEEILSKIISWKGSCCIYLTDEQKNLAEEAVKILNALLETAEPSDEDTQKGGKPQDKTDKPEDHLSEINIDELKKLNQNLRGV